MQIREPGTSASLAALVGRLRMLVVDGVLAAGRDESLADVASLLGVGEVEAGDAVRELGRDGFLERVGSDRVRVRTPDEVPPDDVIALRRLVEPHAHAEAARAARPVDVIALRELAGAVDAALRARDVDAHRTASEALEEAFVSLQANAELTRLCADLRRRTPLDGLRQPVESGSDSTALREHHHLIALVEQRDVAGVEALARRRIDRLHLVGAPRMDLPYLAGPATQPEQPLDAEFLEASGDE